MIRKAIIVASPLKSGHSGFLPGVEMDVENYKSFLTSPVGGSWHSEEIEVHWNPSAKEITKAMNNSNADYVFTVYSGHGGVDKKTRKEFLQINESEAVLITHLTAKSVRQLAIIDACSTFLDSGLSNFTGPESIEFRSSLLPKISREIFDHRVSSSSHGWTVIHSSSPGEASVDTLEGGLYSQSLLRAASIWGAKFEANSILPAPMAYLHSHNYLKNNFKGKQTPRIWHSESKPNFPFALRFGSELAK